MKKEINLKWYIKRLEYLSDKHKTLNNDNVFKSVLNDLKKLDSYKIFREA